ncbi:MAG TPA: patatin-like phospholipase family protein [Candidatus Acidoferrales bacterium]|nr:patatin-like phospholipase family protein [Candidatus Acidoferrales bacterium]
MLGGGGARGAAQVGVLLALFEAKVDPPVRVVGTSVGALNGASICAYPSLAGAQMLEQVWLSDLALNVFRVHPLSLMLSRLRGELSVMPGTNIERLIDRVEAMTGRNSFEQMRIPLRVVATDVGSGQPFVFSSGLLAPALRASTAIPGVFPAVDIGGRTYLDGGIVDNTPMSVAVNEGDRDVLAVSLMAGGERDDPPATYPELIARTLQLSLHHQMLSDYERLKDRARIVVLCPVTSSRAIWEMRREHILELIETSRRATSELLEQRGSKLFRHSGVHYLNLAAG